MSDFFMLEAIKLANISYDIGEVPVGAVIVYKGEIIGRGYNQREMRQNSLMHAELIAIDEASKKLGNWRLNGAWVYVTLEPCIMCAGALLHARVERLFFGAFDQKFGAIKSLYQMNQDTRLNHSFLAEGGLLELESQKLLKDFFLKVRSLKIDKRYMP